MEDSLLKKPVAKNEAGVLAGLWRNILRESHLITSLNVLIDRYNAKYNLELKKSGSAKLKAKSTLIANIVSTEMTFKTFLDLIFNFLNVRRINISIKLTFPDGEETVHSISVLHPDTPNTLTKTKGDKEEDAGERDKKENGGK